MYEIPLISGKYACVAEYAGHLTVGAHEGRFTKSMSEWNAVVSIYVTEISMC